MKFRITFSRTGKKRMLPIDYQYYISAWIYSVIGKANGGFSSFLHHSGYTSGNKKFKFFCYSPLSLGNFTLWKEKSLFEVFENQIALYVSFEISEAAENFIIGLFNRQEAYIGDKFNGLDLRVAQVERVNDPEFSPTMHYRTLSPTVVSRLKKGERYAAYLSPLEAEYPELIRNNLIQKWQTLPRDALLPGDLTWNWKLLSEPRSKLVTIRPYTNQQTRIRGFLYEFILTAPVEFHRLILSSGIGEKNSVGFGWAEVTT